MSRKSGKPSKKCTVDWCDNHLIEARGLCNKHYFQFMKHGKVFKSSLREFNEVVDKGRYYELILTNNKMEEIGRAKIDKEDLELVKSKGRWSLDGDGYVIRNRPRQAMHRLIMGAGENDDVDHKKIGTKYKSDNRKKNLRICTRAQNLHNTGISSRNTSGHKGVHWSERRHAWIVSIRANKVSKYLGQFKDFEKACRKYKEAAKEMHGEYASKEFI